MVTYLCHKGIKQCRLTVMVAGFTVCAEAMAFSQHFLATVSWCVPYNQTSEITILFAWWLAFLENRRIESQNQQILQARSRFLRRRLPTDNEQDEGLDGKVVASVQCLLLVFSPIDQF